MLPEEWEELSTLTQAHDEMLARLVAKGVSVNVMELRLARLEAKLDLLLGDNVGRALLNHQRQIAIEWEGVEESIDDQIARRTLLGPDGGPPTL